jgi:filamentous hemagglutinin family protein
VNGPTSWVGAGSATASASANQLTINQTTSSATLNWSSFNISKGNTVTFVQPGASAVALNQIYQANPAQIFGALNANGVVYLLNQNGILFGSGAQINVGGLVASSLALTPAALSSGIAGAIQSKNAAFEPYTDANGVTQASGDISVQQGATLNSPSGQILLFAPNVTNNGLIQTPDGQTILGAGQRIFLLASSQASGAQSPVRGLLIEVGAPSGSGTATNLGQIIADRGNVTLAGLAVNQDGLVSATTTVRANGSVVLQAQSTSQATTTSGSSLPVDTTGTVTIGSGSVTEVTLEGSLSDVTASVNTQPQSTISVSGGTVNVLGNASISSIAGNVSLSAQSLGSTATAPTSGRIYLAPSSTIDVSGATAQLPMSDNTLKVHLTSTELGNFPIQEKSALLGQNITVDLRQYGTNADGSVWVGTPIADLSPDIKAIQSDVFQRSLTGGTITLSASSSVLIGQGATLNVAGGQIDWQAGYVNPTVLLNQFGQAVPIAAANPQQVYLGVINSTTVGDPRWGVTGGASLPGLSPQGTYQAAYVQGANAGTVAISAPYVAVDGSINGAVVTGPLQRMPNAGANSSAPTFNQIPLGASLVLGPPNSIGATPFTPPSDELGSVLFAPGEVLGALRNSSGQAFDPLTDGLPSGLTTQVRPALLGPGGVTQLSVYSTGAIDLPAGVTLAPGAGGSVLLGAVTLRVDGTIEAPSGAITLEAEAPVGTLPLPLLELGSTAVLSATGEWVNDNPLFGVADTPLLTAGGKIKLTSQNGSLQVNSGALLDVTAGAQETASGATVAGHAGSISVTDNPTSNYSSPGATVVFDPTLRGFALSNGANLSISLPSLCLSSASCGTPGAIRIDPTLLTQNGFGSVSLATNVLGLTVASDVHLNLYQENLQLLPMDRLKPSGTPIESLTQVVTLPQYERSPENLTLSSSSGQPLRAGQSNYADLTLAAGARLALDPLASLIVSSDSRVFDNATIIAPGGMVNIALTTGGQGQGADGSTDDQGIWLGPQSVVDVSGSTVITPNQLGLSTGRVYAGGSITVTAGQGFLSALPGSILKASGTASSLDVQEGAQLGNAYVHEDVVTAGGSIALGAAAGLFVGSTLEANAGPGGRAPGGSLSLALSGQVLSVGAVVPAALEITNASNVPSIAEGAALSAGLVSHGVVPATLINQGGFDQITLSARDLAITNIGVGTSLGGIGALVLDPGVSLAPSISLTLSAPEIRTLGAGTVYVSSAYVALGSNDTAFQTINGPLGTPNTNGTPLISGSATLDVSGQFIDLVGNTDIQGFGNVKLTSAGDIRTRGIQLGSALPQGQLLVPGNLTLTAQQLYPATLSTYGLTSTGATATITVDGQRGTPATVLEAGGSLTLQANSIVNAGTIRAPIGSLTLAASNITLEPGSLLSVSAEGLSIPFGETQGGLAWAYPIQQPTSTLVYGSGSGAVPLPQKQISLTAESSTQPLQQLNFESGASIDLRGGGDLLAFEYTPATSTSKDVLAAANLYALLPQSDLAFAPYDPLIAQGLAYQANQSVYLSGGGGVAAGTYVLLPARYALLPNAYLLQPVSGYANIPSGQQYPQLNGSVVVSGRLLYSGTTLGQTLTSGFDLVPGSYAFKEASYTVTSANNFFSAQATAAGQVAAPLPKDAGRLAINVSNILNLSGTLDATPASGGRGGELDLSASNLVVTASAQSLPAGAVDVSAEQLDALGAAELLLGGSQQIVNGVAQITPQATSVTLQSGAELSAPQVLLVANASAGSTGQITLQPGSKLQASGNEPTNSAPLGLQAASAIVGVSTGAETLLAAGAGGNGASASASTGGAISIASGAELGAAGAVIVAASNVDFSGALSAVGAHVTLQSGQVALGTVPQDFMGFALASSQLPSLAGADLLLRTGAAVQIYGPVALNVSQLLLDAPGLVAETADASVSLTAGLVTLQNSSAGAAAAAGAQGGQLSATAGSIALGAGTFSIGGFSQSNLSAAKDLSLAGTGQLQVGGNLALTAGVFQGTSAVTYGITATGSLSTDSPSPVHATASAAPGAGLSLQGSSVSLGGNFALTAGALSVAASNGDVEILPGSTINLSGQAMTFAGETVSSPGGSLTLQAAGGSVTVDTGALIDVSSGTGSAQGGSLSLGAPTGSVVFNGTLRGSGGAGATGGSLSVIAQSLDFSGLVATATAAGMTGALALHERGSDPNGSGSFALAAGSTIKAANVELTADQGSITIDGTIDASSPSGGAITLSAQNDIVINGSLIAMATGDAARGGEVQLTTPAGGVYLTGGSLVNIGGQAGVGAALQSTGTLWITAPRPVVSSVLNPTPGAPTLQLAGTVVGAGQLIVEGNQAYATTSPGQSGYTLSASDVSASATNPYYQDAVTFMGNAGAIAGALGQASNAAFQLLPGVELDTNGDLNIANTFDLSTWRFNGNVAGVLTLRATGNVLVNASVSDGFPSFDPNNPQGAYVLAGTPGSSWSYRIAAGADSASADPLAVVPLSAVPASGASVVLAPGVPADPVNGVNAPIVVRTGTGSIQIAAAQNLVLSNQASVIYTAGEAGPGYILQDPASQDGLNGLVYPVSGGSIRVQVGGNVIGATSNQLFTDWLWRTGEQASSDFGYVPTAWTVNFGSFEQGIGALGGGDLTVIAGGNIVDLGAVVPSVGAPLTATSLPTEINAGLLTIEAGGSILGGKFLDMAGAAAIRAGNQLGQGTAQQNLNGQTVRGLYPVLALGDSQFNVNARSDLTIETAVDPTLLNPSLEQGVFVETSYFSSYGSNSRVALLSGGGNVTLVNQPGGNSPLATTSANLSYTNGTFGQTDMTLRVYAPTLDVATLGGSIDVQGSVDLWPAANGNLDLLAARDVAIASASGLGALHIVMSAADPTSAVPTVALPGINASGVLGLLDQPFEPASTPQYYAAQPLHGGAFSSGQPDTTPARIVALNGDLSMQPSDIVNSSALFIPKPVDIYAGGNIVDLGVNIEQFAASNVSTISAGGSLTYPTGRNKFGQLALTNRAINVSGPGELVVNVGGSLDLGTSSGISTFGSLVDPALPPGGASINVIAGVSPALEYPALIDQYLQPGSSYDSALVSYVETLTGRLNLTAAEALMLFKGFTIGEQQPLLADVLVGELRAGGRSAAAPGPNHNNFTRAFDGLTAMFPGANPSAGQTNPYSGDILLYFSRIYTLDGGDINLLSPGGQINVGLATPPTAFGVGKAAAQLGIVAQSTGSVSGVSYTDISVNQSRVFAADGGNILLWSTDGNIDAGRGAKSAISAPPPTIVISASGIPQVTFPPALTGSGIQTLSTTVGLSPGDVDLFAPHGVVNANEAGIVAGNLTIAATAVLGTNNISVSGTSVGVPVPVSGQGLAATAAGSSTAAATNAGIGTLEQATNQSQTATPLADSAIAFLDVFVLGLGEEQCSPTDLECLKRQPH